MFQEPPWSASLLGCPCPWAAHQDHRQEGKDCWCLQEEINLMPFSCSMLAYLHSLFMIWWNPVRPLHWTVLFGGLCLHVSYDKSWSVLVYGTAKRNFAMVLFVDWVMCFLNGDSFVCWHVCGRYLNLWLTWSFALLPLKLIRTNCSKAFGFTAALWLVCADKLVQVKPLASQDCPGTVFLCPLKWFWHEKGFGFGWLEDSDGRPLHFCRHVYTLGVLCAVFEQL
jgi:hypothetical protein